MLKVMSQMTNFRKVLGACLAVFVLMGVQSCNRDVAEPSSVEGKTQAEEIIYKEGTEEMPISETLTFDFSEEENQLKALDATVSATTGTTNRHGVAYANKIPVVCIVRSNQGDPVTYVNDVEIIKQANGTYKFAKDRVRLRAGSTLAPGKKWYLMVVTQNVKINKDNGDLTVNANGNAETLSPSATRVMDIPSASPWIELPMFPNGQPKWSKDWDAPRKAKRLKLYPQGVLCRATLRLDDAYKTKLGSENVDLKITQLKVVSTALSFSGKFKFDAASLPPITQTEGRPTIKWEPTQTASTAKEYRALDANTPEYQKVFNNPNGVLQLSGSGSLTTIFADSNNPARVDKANLPEGVKSILFWAVPVKGVTNRHTTLIAETGSSSSSKVLQPSHTYIYGKKHTKDAGQGRAVYFDAVYYNPYTPLDYMAEYNVKRKNPEQFVPGGWIPQGSSNVFDTEHGVNSFTFLLYEEAEKVSLTSEGRTYKLPTHAQWSSVIPYEGAAAINTVGGEAVNGEGVYAQLGQVKSWTKFSSKVDTEKKIRYALALTDFGGSQKYRTAYRYKMEYGEGSREIGSKYIKVASHLLKTNFARRQHPYRAYDQRFSGDGAYALYQNLVLTIQAVQLGAGFVGTVDDIANEDFWNNTANQHKDVRILPRNFTTYTNASKPDAYDSMSRSDKNYFATEPRWSAVFNAWNNAPTVYYLGDSQLAVFDAPKGLWTTLDMRVSDSYTQIRFPVRPFTTQER